MTLKRNGPSKGGAPQRFACPDCSHAMRIVRTHETGSPLMRSKTYQCTNAEVCGSTFRGEECITSRISPGAAPNPQIVLPLSKTCH